MAVIRIDGDASGALRSISQIESALGGIQKSVSAATRSLGGLQSALASIAGIAAGGSLMSFVDDLQNMQNKLRIATGSQEEFNKSMEYVKAIADKTGQSLASTGDLYASVARNAQKLGYDQNQVVTVTNAMATALKASGASAQGSASVMYQFSQILAKGKVNGDEFTTIMENLGGPVMDLVAKNMGLTTAQLIKYKEKGLIGAKDFTDALIRSMSDLDGMAGKSSQTIGQSMQRIQNAFGTAILAIDNASGIGATFADIAKKISDNGENLIPVIKVIGVVMAGLAVFFAPVVSLFVAGAAAALYFADVLGPILKPVVDAVSAALSGLGRQLVGIGAGLMALIRGENPFDAYSKALDEFDNKAKALPKAAKGAKLLDDALKGAQQTTTATANQLTGIGDKYAEILKDLKAEAALQGATSKELDIQKQLLTVNKQLEYGMSEEQKKELTVLYKKIQAKKDEISTNEMLNKLQSDTTTARIQDQGVQQVTAQLESYRLSVGKETYEINKNKVQAAIQENIQQQALTGYLNGQRQAQIEINSLTITDVALREQQLRIETERLRLGSLFTAEMEATLKATVKAEQAAKAQANITQELLKLEDERYGLGIADLKQREIAVAIRAKERELGSALTQDMKDQLAVSLQLTQAARDREQITQSLRAATQSLTGVEAGKAAAGQMSSLDPTLAAQRSNETLFNGLEYLRSQDLISEQSYQNAKINAAVQAQDAIMAATKKQYENESLLRIQEQTGKQFGYEQQKQMAAEAARFEMLSTMEKTQFGIEQAASLFSTLGAQNKKAFEASKALNIASAIMNTYMGATKAMATYPWPFGLIAAAAAVAAGMAQVNAIRSQQYSGRALGGPVMGGKPYIVGENGPEVFTPSTTGSITRNQDLGSSAPTNINFTIVANDTQGFDQLLSSRKGVIQQIISDAMLERGQRSMV